MKHRLYSTTAPPESHGLWARVMTTEGARVRHDELGWTGTVVVPAPDTSGRGTVPAESTVLVRHFHQDGRADAPQVVERWYLATDLSPASADADTTRHGRD